MHITVLSGLNKELKSTSYGFIVSQIKIKFFLKIIS